MAVPAKIEIFINTENDSFSNDWQREVRVIIRGLFTKMESIDGQELVNLYDTNGNNCGEAEFTV